MTRIFLPRRPPALFASSTAMSIPFFVEMPNVAVVPVNDPNSPTIISDELESDRARVHAPQTRAPNKHKRSNHGLFFMNPPSGRIPEESVVLPLWFFVLILLRRTMIMRGR